MERQLATVQVIGDIEPIPDADKIELCRVMGWQSVVKKGDFTPGDKIIYAEIDSLLPEEPQYEFLRKCCYTSANKGFRIKSMKIRGCLSQGLILPLSVLGEHAENAQVGDDVTELLGIRKWERAPAEGEKARLFGHARGSLPHRIPKTDETRIQSCVDVLKRHEGKMFSVTEKYDGTSMSVFWDPEDGLHVCSRNVDLKPDYEHKWNGTAYWDYAIEHDLESIVHQIGDNVVLQGELIGPGIQGNHYKLEALVYRVFNMYDLNTGKYSSYQEMSDRVKELGLGNDFLVHEICNISLPNDLRAMLKLSKGKSVYGDMQREGIVCRAVPEDRDVKLGRLSFKVINDDFLLKKGE